MKYRVRIRCNATGEIRLSAPCDWPDDGSLFLWEEGNMVCDCNRKAEFLRADLVSEEEIEREEFPCGRSEYAAIEAIRDDGLVFKIDGDDAASAGGGS